MLGDPGATPQPVKKKVVQKKRPVKRIARLAVVKKSPQKRGWFCRMIMKVINYYGI